MTSTIFGALMMMAMLGALSSYIPQKEEPLDNGTERTEERKTRD